MKTGLNPGWHVEPHEIRTTIPSPIIINQTLKQEYMYIYGCINLVSINICIYINDMMFHVKGQPLSGSGAAYASEFS